MPAARKTALTDRTLQALLRTPPVGKRVIVWDAAQPNFAARVTKNGKLSFIVVRRQSGKPNPTWVTLGEYPTMTLAEARQLAREALGLLTSGHDPHAVKAEKRRVAQAAEQTARENSFAAVAEDFIKRRDTRGLRRADEGAATIRRELIPVWGQRPISDIRHRDVVTLIEAIVDRNPPAVSVRRRSSGGPHAARHALASARLLFGWAFRREIIELDPTARIVAQELHGLAQTDLQRDRVLNDDEIRLLWRAVEATPYPFGPLVQLLLRTGARLSEWSEASWGEIDLAAATLTVPTDRMKMKIPHVVPLTPAALAIVEAMPRFTGGNYLFTTTGGARPFSGIARMKARLEAAIGAIPPWTLHDLRRTCRTRLAEIGVTPFIGELVVGHVQRGVHGVYDRHRYLDEKRDALMRWEKRLLGIVAPEPEAPKIVPLRSRVRA